MPAFSPALWLMITAALVGAVGSAIFGSVDQALNTEVLPDPKTAAKDLGVLNVAITAGQAAGPVITSVVVATAGGYQWVFPTSAILGIVAAILIKLIRSVP